MESKCQLFKGGLIGRVIISISKKAVGSAYFPTRQTRRKLCSSTWKLNGTQFIWWFNFNRSVLLQFLFQSSILVAKIFAVFLQQLVVFLCLLQFCSAIILKVHTVHLLFATNHCNFWCSWTQVMSCAEEIILLVLMLINF